MQRTVRAVYTGGVLKPLEKLDLEEGKQVLVKSKRAQSPSPAGTGRNTE